MNLGERFRDVFSKVEFELARAYAICNDKEEIVFFYETWPNDASSYRIGEIRYVYARDHATGAMSKCEIDGQLLEQTDKCKDEIIKPAVMNMDAFELEDKYRALYEEYYADLIAGKKDLQKKAELKRIFDELVPDSNLKDLYLYLGREFFE